jgi:hypothetical protein
VRTSSAQTPQALTTAVPATGKVRPSASMTTPVARPWSSLRMPTTEVSLTTTAP